MIDPATPKNITCPTLKEEASPQRHLHLAALVVVGAHILTAFLETLFQRESRKLREVAAL